MKYAVKSDRGLVREVNEDSYDIISGCPGNLAAFIIADGMGGHNSGEIASKLAVDFASSHISQAPEQFSREEDIVPALKSIMEKANAYVYKYSMEHEDNFGMGTTLIIAVICQNKLYIGHVGDSRVYLIRDGKIEQLTTDHSYIEELIRNGSLTREEAQSHPSRNVITRALGCLEDVQIDTYTYDIQQDDLILMCTDGLTNKLEESEITDIVLGADCLESACDKLVDKANEKGGEDNITVILIKN